MDKHWTYDEAVKAEEERERERQAKRVRHIDFRYMSGWKRLEILSIVCFWVPVWRRKSVD